MKNIPIVFATDNNYEFALVAMSSLCIHAAEDTFYNIYIFIDDSFLFEKEIKDYMKNYSNVCNLSFKNVGNVFDNIPIWNNRLTKGCYFRLFAPWILNENKCMYLDTDVIVLSDLSDLFDFSLGDNYVAGVKAPDLVLKKGKEKEEWCKQAELSDLDQYINSGVLLMNLDKMRQDDIVNKFIEKLPKNMETADQDIINSVCYGKIKFIPFRYNVKVSLAKWDENDYKETVLKSELFDAWNVPKIIHYVGKEKPWNNLNCPYGDYWWEICRKTPLWDKFFENLKYEFYFKAIYNSSGENITTKKVSKLFNITVGRKYVIYGAGIKAKLLISYLNQKNIPVDFIIVSDKANNPMEIEGIKVKDLSEVKELLHDRTILLAVKELFHQEVLKNLLEFDYKECIPISDKWEENYKLTQ